MSPDPGFILPDPILAYCLKAYPNKPAIDVNEKPWTRKQLGDRIDYWMNQIERLADAAIKDNERNAP